MDEKKNGKSKIWIYAVVLFTSAFIVLLLTAYSQIKLNKNLSNYKDKVYSTESERNMYQLNFSSAQETNNKLKDEIEKLKSDNKSLSDKYKKMAGDRVKEAENSKLLQQEYNELSAAQVLYLNEKYVEASMVLIQDIDVKLLDDTAKEVYTALLDKSGAKAGSILFKQGYGFYKKKDYASAINSLTQALNIAPLDKSADSWLYYLAVSEYNSGSIDKALEHMGSIVSKYNESNYLKRAKRFCSEHAK